jgi:hypothetical protein
VLDNPVPAKQKEENHPERSDVLDNPVQAKRSEAAHRERLDVSVHRGLLEILHLLPK